MEQALSEAAIRGSVESLHQIIAKDELILQKIVVGCSKGKSPLHVAVSSGQTQFVVQLLSLKPELAEVLDSQLRSALHLASAKGHIGMVNALVKASPQMCLARDRDGRNPLHVAALKGNIKVLDELIRAYPQAARDRVDRDETILHLASAAGHIEIVKALMNPCPELCLARDRDGRNPLHIAAIKGQIEILKELVRTSPQAARVRVDHDETILHLCVKHKQFETLEQMLAMIRDKEFVEAQDKEGNTIFHLAILYKHVEVFQIIKKVLQKIKIDVNAKNASGHTAMDIFFLEDGELDTKDLDRNLLDFLQEAKAKRANDLLQGDWLTKKKDSLMIVASLIATMAFQAGVNPPGGVWQDNSNGHRAGEAVMAYNYPDSYPYFLHSNTVGFVASLSIILLLISGLSFKKKAYMWILILIMWVTITSMAFTYAFSNVVVTPKKDRRALSYTIEIAVIVWCTVMALVLLYHTIRSIADFVKEYKRRNEAIERISQNLSAITEKTIKCDSWSLVHLLVRLGVRGQPPSLSPAP